MIKQEAPEIKTDSKTFEEPEKLEEPGIFVKTETDIKPEIIFGVGDSDSKHVMSTVSDDPLAVLTDNLKKHIQTVHEGKNQFKCNFCDHECATNYHLKRHIEGVHERIKPFKCNICDYESATKANLNKHVESVHEGIKPFKPFKCNSCERY